MRRIWSNRIYSSSLRNRIGRAPPELIKLACRWPKLLVAPPRPILAQSIPQIVFYIVECGIIGIVHQGSCIAPFFDETSIVWAVTVWRQDSVDSKKVTDASERMLVTKVVSFSPCINEIGKVRNAIEQVSCLLR